MPPTASPARHPTPPPGHPAGSAPEDPATTVRYPRDRSLDPQLVWKGKDEQDARPLEVPAVPIHVQEKIHPQAIVEDVKRRAVRRASEGSANSTCSPTSTGWTTSLYFPRPNNGHAA